MYDFSDRFSITQLNNLSLQPGQPSFNGFCHIDTPIVICLELERLKCDFSRCLYRPPLVRQHPLLEAIAPFLGQSPCLQSLSPKFRPHGVFRFG